MVGFFDFTGAILQTFPMKRVISLGLCALLLAGCASTPELNAVQDVTNETISKAELLEAKDGLYVIEAKEDLGSVYDALLYLQGIGLISIEGSEDAMGFYLKEINNEKADNADKTYWAFYTTLMEDDGKVYASGESGSLDYEDQILGYALYGISSVPFKEGNLYALKLETY